MDGVRNQGEMNFVVTDVKKPLAAVSAIVEAGNEVVFKPGKHDSFISNPKTGERITLRRERGTYTMDVELEGLLLGGEDPGASADFSGQA